MFENNSLLIHVYQYDYRYLCLSTCICISVCINVKDERTSDVRVPSPVRFFLFSVFFDTNPKFPPLNNGPNKETRFYC